MAASPASTQVHSSPGQSWSPIRRVKSDTWKEGWKSDAETLASAPRWSMGGKAGFHTPEPKKQQTENISWDTGGRSRDTWVQAHARRSFTPGPGKYRTDQDFPMNKCKGTDWVWKTDAEESDTVNIGNTRRERTAKWSLSKSDREANQVDVKLSPMKPSYMQVRKKDGTSSECFSTPGPGHYSQPTQFGAASGGHRHHFFPTNPMKGKGGPPGSAKRSSVVNSAFGMSEDS